MKARRWWFFSILLLNSSLFGYLPIVLVHGILSDDYEMAPTEHYIRKYMGEDVYVKNIQLGLGPITSLTNVYHQAKYLWATIQSDPNLKDGFNLIAHSQGGLVARYYIEKHNNPPYLPIFLGDLLNKAFSDFPERMMNDLRGSIRWKDMRIICCIQNRFNNSLVLQDTGMIRSTMIAI